jgi:hypothetical protein
VDESHVATIHPPSAVDEAVRRKKVQQLGEHVAKVGAPHAVRAADPAPCIVIGVGNSLSGEVPFLLLGDAESHVAVALREFSETIRARSGLRIPVIDSSRADAAKRAAAAVVLDGTDAVEGEVLKRFLAAGRGVVLDIRSSRRPDLGVRGESWRRRIRRRPEGNLPASFLYLLRRVLEDRRVVRHLPTVFEDVRAREIDGHAVFEAETVLPGRVTLSMVTVDGTEIVPEGDLRPVPVETLEAAVNDTLVRLRYRDANGLEDETRCWLPDLLPGRLPHLRVLGPAASRPGDAPTYHVVVETGNGRPVEGCRARARLLDREVGGVTNEAGACILRLPPLPAEVGDGLLLELEVEGAHFRRTHEIPLRIAPAAHLLTAETDRPVYRPGGTVRLRALVVDARSRAGVAGQDVTASVFDPRERRIAVLETRTGRFGAAVMELPLAEGIVEGDYRVELTGAGARTARTLRVEEIVRPEIDVTVRLDRLRFGPDEAVTGTIETRTFDGEPLSGASIEVSLKGPHGKSTAWSTESAAARQRFSLPAGAVGEGVADLEAHVSHGGESACDSLAVPIGAPPPPDVVITTIPEKPLGGHAFELTLEVRDEDGERIPATLAVRLDDDEETTVAAPEGVARIPVPGRPALTKLDVAVCARTAKTTVEGKRTIRVDTGLRIHAPAVAAPGSDLPVTVLASTASGHVHVDLVADGRILAAASGRLRHGVLAVTLPLPEDHVGPVHLYAHGPDRPIESREVRIVRGDLQVRVEPGTRDARPGESAEVAIEVRDAAGARVPALLDVRSVDASYLAAIGKIETRAIVAFPAPSRPKDLPVLVEDLASEAWVRLDARIQAAARPVLERARLDVLAGRPVTARLPWEAPVVAGRIGRAVLLSGESAVTRASRPCGLTAPRLAVWDADGHGVFPAREVLPLALPRHPFGSSSRDGAVDRGLEWLARHQSPDGSFDPTAYADRCEGPGCDGIADPALRPGTTALAVLAYLGAGETHRIGRYRAHVKAALRYLGNLQAADGFIGDPGGPWANLNHAMATLALGEAYAMTGSPLFRSPATRAIRALEARRREDGSFAEPGWSRGSLVLTAWATMALKSAQMSGLPFDRTAMEGVGRWIEANADARTGIVDPSAEDLSRYPFPRTDRPGHAAGMTILMRIFLGEDARRSDPIRRAADVMLGGLPEYVEGECDFHGWWFGTMALFQVGGEPWKAWNVALKKAVIDFQRQDGCPRGSWDPGLNTVGRIGRTCFGSMCLEVYYRYGRVFGIKGGRRLAPRVRSDFPDLSFVDLARPTDGDGRAKLKMHLADSVTTWNVLVGAWDGRGRYARTEGAIRARLPLHASFTLPPRLVVGDVLRLPVRVRSTLDEDVETVVTIPEIEGLEVAPKGPVTIAVPAGGMAAATVALTALREGEARLRVAVAGGEHRDAVEHRTRIEAPGVPVAFSTVVPPGEKTSVADRVPAEMDSLAARLMITTSALGDAAAGLEALLRRPTGCFEQTSATLYPALLAYGVLQRTGRLEGPQASLARRHLLAGYQRLLGFEAPGGGFSLFREGDPRPDLTALGIHETLDLAAVLAIDEGVIERAAAFLAKREIDDPAARLYAMGALRRTGRDVDAGQATAAALAAGDPYLTALAAVHDLLGDEEKQRARALLEATAVPGKAGVVWRSGSRGLFSGTGVSDLETTALATLALARLGARDDLVTAGLAAVRAARRGRGAWTTTRQTVAALRALLLVSRERTVTRGTLTVRSTGRSPIVRAIGGTDAPLVLDLGPWNRKDALTLEFEGTGKPWTTLMVEGRAVEHAGGRGPLELSVAWPAEPLRRAARAEIPVRLVNPTRLDVSCPTAEIRLPAGLVTERGRLEKAARAAGFRFAEIRDGRVVLYLDRLRPGASVEVEVPVRARHAGRFRPGASRVYPYYEPDRETVAGDAVVTVSGD